MREQNYWVLKNRCFPRAFDIAFQPTVHFLLDITWLLHSCGNIILRYLDNNACNPTCFTTAHISLTFKNYTFYPHMTFMCLTISYKKTANLLYTTLPYIWCHESIVFWTLSMPFSNCTRDVVKWRKSEKRHTELAMAKKQKVVDILQLV